MAGTVGFTGGSDGSGTSSSVSVGTDPTGAVTVTITPCKAPPDPPDPGATPDPTQPPTVLKGDGTSQVDLPGPGQEAGTFVYKVGDPLFVKIELLATCEVTFSVSTNQDLSAPIYTLSFPSQKPPTKKIMLVSLLRQAAADAKPKPKTDAPAAPQPLKVNPVKPPPKVLQPDH